MKSSRAILISVLVLVSMLVFSGTVLSQKKVKTKSTVRVPKYSLSVSAGFSYMLGTANGQSRGFISDYNTPSGHLFTSKNLGMQEGYGLTVTGKDALGKKRKFRVTGTLGYNLFYNTLDRGKNRTKWNLFNLGAGVEYSFSPKQKQRLIVGAGIDYTLMFGAWQSDITYPDGYVSNIYTKFNPASRLGASANAGMEFRLSKKMDMNIGIKGSWVNIIPRQNSYTSQAYETYINDSKSNSGIEFSNSKNIIYMQVFAGITLPIGYK